MKTSSRLPDFIHVARLKDLFWNNNSDLYPNTVPNPALYTKIPSIRPVFQSPYMGTIVLQGEYNHCIYNGLYYQLSKLELKDVIKKEYKYQLIVDVVLNFLLLGGEIKGTLIRTNDESILEKVIQTTQPVLSSPAILNYVNFSDPNKYNWKETKNLIDFPPEEIEQKLWLPYITYREWSYFIFRIKNNIFGKKLKQWEYSEKANTSNYLRHDYINPLYIIDYLPTVKYTSWKNVILKKIKESFKDLSNKIITVQTQVKGSYFQGKKCISWQEDSIGEREETSLQIQKIDLSKLTDIVPIDEFNNQMEPNMVPTDSDLLDDDIPSIYSPFLAIKLGRTPYLPIYNGEGELDLAAFLPNKYPDFFNNIEDTGYTGNNPQTIEFNDGLVKDNKKGYLWYLNRNNIALIGANWKNWLTQGPKDSDFIKQKLIYETSNSWWNYFFFYNLDRKNIPSLGFIIFQLITNFESWDDYEYIGSRAITKILYRSGLKQKLLDDYLDPSDKWWSRVPKEVSLMNGIPQLSYLTLDTNLMTWLTIVPSPYYYPYYKYLSYREWGVAEVFPDRSNDYVSNIINFDINWSSGGRNERIQNPLTNDRIKPWLYNRENILNDISFTKKIDIPELKKGDILASSLEYEWMKVIYYDYEFPFSFTESELTKYFTSIKNFKDDTRIAKNLINKGTITILGSKKPSVGEQLAEGTAYGLGVAILFGLGLGAIGLVAFITAALLTTGVGLAADAYVKNQSVLDSLHNSAALTSDFFLSEKIPLNHLNDHLVVYLHKGQIKLGVYKEIKTNFSLSESADQIVKTVDGTKDKSAKLYIIKQIDEVKIDYKSQSPILGDHEQELLNQAYAHLRGSNNKKIFEYNEERLKKGMHHFDLVGTDWTVFFYKGKPHLIAKNDKPFINPDTKISKIIFKGEKVPSVYDQINQKAELCVYGQTFLLNTKFGFKEDEQFNVFMQEIIPANKKLNLSQIHLLVDNPNDYINTWIKIDKKIPSGTIAEVNPIEYELLMHQIERDRLSYQQDKASNELLMEQKRIELIRRREDLNLAWWDTLASTIGLASSSVFTGARFGRDMGRIAGMSKSKIAKGTLAKLSIGGVATGAAFGIASTIFNAYTGFKKYNIETARVGEDERLIYRENMENMFHRKQNYEHEYKSRVIQLNGLTNAIVRGGVNDREIQEEFNKLNHLTNINIQVYLPSSEQSKVIKYIYDYFGCECVSDIYKTSPLIVKSGKIKGIYQFANLHGDGVVSSYTTDLSLNATIRNIFETGVKFTEYEHIFLDQDEIEIADVPIYAPPVYDVDDINNWPKEKWDRYYYTHNKDEILNNVKKLDKFGLTEEELAANPDIKNLSDDELVDKINEIISNRKTGKVYVIPFTPKEPDSDDLLKAKKELELLRAQFDSLYKSCEEDKQNIKNDLVNKESELNDVKEQLRQCRINLTNLQKTKEYCDKTNAAFIKELEKAKRKCEAELAAKKAEIDLGKQGITVKEGEVESLHQKITELEQKVKECETLKQQLDNEIKQHKIDKEELEQKLNDERRRAINEKEEINKLHKQLEESSVVDPFEIQKNTKFDFSKYSSSCELMQYILNEPYSFDIKDRDNGWNTFKDLLVHIGSSLLFARKADVDQKVMEIDYMRPIVEKLVELENTPIMSKLMDIMTLPTWWKYAEYINKNKNKGKDVDDIQTKIDEWSQLQNDVNINGIKAILDELNYLVYKAKSKIKAENIPENRDVELFFDSVYPSHHNLWYKHAFGSYDIALSKKIFTRDINCVDRMTARDVKKSKWYEVGLSLAKSIEEAQTIFVPGDSDKYKPWLPGGGKVSSKFVPRFLDNKLSNDLDDIVPALSFFEESNKPIGWTWDKRDNKGRRTWLIKYIQPPTYTYEKDSKGYATTYHEKAMYVEIYMPYRKITDYENRSLTKRVFLTNAFRPKKKRYEDVVKQTEELWNKKHQMSVNSDFLDKLKAGNIKIKIKINLLWINTNNDKRSDLEAITFTVEIPQQTIDDFARKGYLEDFVKFLYIFDRNRIGWQQEGYDYYNQEYFSLRIATGANMKDYTKLGEPINGKQPENRYFEVGWITGFMSDDILQFDDGSQIALFDNAKYCTYNLLNYFYKLVTTPGWFIHPWKLGDQGAYKLFSTMYRVGS